MEIEFEDNYSVCQTTCIICESKSSLIEANYSKFHKVCLWCREKNSLDEVRECRECNTKVKVLKNVGDGGYGMVEKQRISYQTVTLPKSREIDGDGADYKCGHVYCGSCRKKNEECPFCRVKQRKKCCICYRSVILEKKGDFWFCPYCLYFSLECLACSISTYRLPLKQKCEVCNCECIESNTPCKHKFCKTHTKSPCRLCLSSTEYECKFCKALDVLCKNSICPLCSIKASKKFCLLCKAPV